MASSRGDTHDAATGSGTARGLTIRGRSLLAGGLAALLCAVLLDERDLLRLGLLGVALPLAAALLTAHRLPSLRVAHRVRPDPLQPGAVGTVDTIITNTARWRTAPLRVQQLGVPDLMEGGRFLLSGIPRGATAVTTLPLYAGRRGRFRLAPLTVRVQDPFGLWQATRTVDTGTIVIVVPVVTPLVGSPAPTGAAAALTTPATAGIASGEPDVRLRDYTPGDDIRTVHWRASARRDELLVRQREPLAHGGATVLIDLRRGAHHGSGPDSSLETAISVGASAAVHLVQQDYRVDLVGHDGAAIGSGRTDAPTLLADLAVVDADGTDTAPVVPATGGLIIAVLGAMDRAQAGRLAAGRPRSAVGIALIVETTDWADPGSGATLTAAACASVMVAAGWRAAVLRRGQDPAAIWRTVTAGGLPAGIGR